MQRLAEHPDDRALRLVFADRLLEQGDPRGEVIALSERGTLSLSERRRVARLTDKHAAQWLGPLAPLADLQRTRFEGGFLEELVIAGSAPGDALARFAGAPELATVKSLAVAPGLRVTALRGFLSHPVLARLERLELGVLDWQALAGFAPGALAPPVVAVAGFGVFTGELSPLAHVELLQRGKRLELLTTEFVNPLVATEIRQALAAQHRVLAACTELRLVARYAVFEGAVAWLLRGDDAGLLETLWPHGRRWGVDYAEVVFTLERDGEGRLSHLVVDCSARDVTGGLDKRINAAAGVLVQLAPARLTRVDVRLPSGAGLRKGERDALRAALRRSGTVEHFTLGDEAILP